jgi:hypothetical protein
VEGAALESLLPFAFLASEVYSNGTVGSSAFGRHQTFCQHLYACSALSALFSIVSNFETVVPVPVEKRMRRGTPRLLSVYPPSRI